MTYGATVEGTAAGEVEVVETADRAGEAMTDNAATIVAEAVSKDVAAMVEDVMTIADRHAKRSSHRKG